MRIIIAAIASCASDETIAETPIRKNDAARLRIGNHRVSLDFNTLSSLDRAKILAEIL
jgi:hypothetical protein